MKCPLAILVLVPLPLGAATVRVPGDFSTIQAALDAAADADDGGSLDITDAVFLLGHLFLGGAAPPAPFPACGADPTPDTLTCASYPLCV